MAGVINFDRGIAKRKLIRYKEDQKLQGYLQVALTLSAFSIFAAFAIRPSVVSVLNINSQKNELDEINEKLENKQAALSKIEGLHEKYADEFALIDKALPSNPMEEDILVTFQTIGAQNSVLITNINFSDSGSGIEGAKTLAMQMSLKGTYENLLGFISDAQNLLRVVTIDNIAFSPQGGSGLIRANIKVSSYYISAEEEE